MKEYSTVERILAITVPALMFLIICYATAVLLSNRSNVSSNPCKKGHYEKSPHHIMCLNNNKNILCDQEGEWETYFVCDEN